MTRKKTRALGRSVTDFSKLSPAEQQLLEHAAAGKPCNLSADARSSRIENARACLRDSTFFPRVADYILASPALPTELPPSLQNQPILVQSLIRDLTFYANRYPLAHTIREVLNDNRQEGITLLQDLYSFRFKRELSAWRSVDTSDVSTHVRADFLRFLALGGDDTTPVHETGIHLVGAYITGTLSLEDANSVLPLSLRHCVFQEQICFHNAIFDRVILDGSCAPYINGDNSEFKGDLSLSDGFIARGGARFVAAEIGEQLICDGATFFFRPSDNVALNLSNCKVSGDISLSDEFFSFGTTNLVGAVIGADFSCRNSVFDCASNSSALDDQRMELPRSLDLQGAEVKGALMLDDPSVRQSVPSRLFEFKFYGSLDLAGATCRYMIDGLDPARKIAPYTLARDGGHVDCRLYLDGFTYTTIHGTSSWEDELRKDWLLRQPTRHLNNDFRPQPWTQLISVYNSVGHSMAARQIYIDREHRRARQARRKYIELISSNRWRELVSYEHFQTYEAFKLLRRKFFYLIVNSVNFAVHLFFEPINRAVLAYGYARKRLVALLFVAWAGSAFVFSQAAEQGYIVPQAPALFLRDSISNYCAANWTACSHPKLPRELTRFSPQLYSFDLLIPFISFGQDDVWRPIEIRHSSSDNHASGFRLKLPLIELSFEMSDLFPRRVAAITVFVGWLLTFLIAAFFSGLIKKD